MKDIIYLYFVKQGALQCWCRPSFLVLEFYLKMKQTKMFSHIWRTKRVTFYIMTFDIESHHRKPKRLYKYIFSIQLYEIRALHDKRLDCRQLQICFSKSMNRNMKLHNLYQDTPVFAPVYWNNYSAT